MKKVISVLSVSLFYLLTAACIGAYVFFSLSVDRLTPIARVLLLFGVALFLYFGSLIFAKVLRPQDGKFIMEMTFWAIFGLYLVLLINFTLLDGYYGRGNYILIFFAPEEMTGMYTSTSINLIPFKNIFGFIGSFLEGELSSRFFYRNILGNIAAFMPFALFVPLLMKRFSKLLSFSLFTAGCIVVVEVTQIMLVTGFCDIDDLILNLGGACIMYGILHIPFVRRIVAKVTILMY